jgi:hypothetical protein
LQGGVTDLEFMTPEPLKRELEELHDELRKAAKEGGAVGDAAKALAKLMNPHFVKKTRTRCRRSDSEGEMPTRSRSAATAGRWSPAT